MLPEPLYLQMEQLKMTRGSELEASKLMLDLVIDLHVKGLLQDFQFPVSRHFHLFEQFQLKYVGLLGELEMFLHLTMDLGAGTKAVLPYLDRFSVDPQLLLLIRKSKLKPSSTIAAWRKKKLVRKLLYQIFEISHTWGE